MSKELFDNVGRNIKTIAKAVANWILGLHILIGVAIIICGCAVLAEGYSIGWVGFLIAFGIFAFGYILSRLIVMLLYAYGEITDRLISIDIKMPNNRKSTRTDGITVKPEKKSDNNTPHRTSPWECQFCGHLNPLDARFCKSCGTEDIVV